MNYDPEWLYCNAKVDELPTGDGVACGVDTDKKYRVKAGTPGHKDCTPENCSPMPFCEEHAQQFREEGLLDE